MGVGQVKRSDVVWLVGLTAVFAISILWHPADDGGFVLCVFRLATGLPCPGCGMTRSFCAIGKGDIERALIFHPLGPTAFIAAIAIWLRSGASIIGLSRWVERFDSLFRRQSLAIVACGLMLGVWIVRLTMLFAE